MNQLHRERLFCKTEQRPCPGPEQAVVVAFFCTLDLPRDGTKVDLPNLVILEEKDDIRSSIKGKQHDDLNLWTHLHHLVCEDLWVRSIRWCAFKPDARV